MQIGISLPVRELKDDLSAVLAFAQAAEEFGYTHLRVPDQVLRPNNGHLHEPMTLLAYVAAVTKAIELVPSVIVTPARQTILLAKQAATLDVLSGGHVRLGIGVGGSSAEYGTLGADFHTRGARIEEQIDLMRLLWTQENGGLCGSLGHGRGRRPQPPCRSSGRFPSGSAPAACRYRGYAGASDAKPTAGSPSVRRNNIRP